MDGTGKHAIARSCPCSRCRSQPDGPTAKQHGALNDLVATLDEKSRRLAQRQTASSKESPLARSSARFTLALCSTPDGVIEGITG